MFGVSNTSSVTSGPFTTTPKTDTNSLFKPSFEATGFNSTTSPSGFFGNFQNTTPVNNTFGTATTNFGTPQHSSSTNLFGSQQQQPLSLFGAPQQNNSSFFNQTSNNSAVPSGLFSTPSLSSATPSKLFTNSVQQPSNVSLFNSGTPNSNLFGTGSFGATASTTNSRVGTKGIQYREEQDATAQAKICCITFLPEINQQKCLEELRYEDYVAGNHTNLNVLNQTTSQSLFSSQNLLPNTTTSFNTSTAPTSTTPTGILTGQSTINTPSNFNNPSNTFFGGFSKDNSKPSTGLFGSTSNSIFSSSNPTQSVFGSKPTTSLFGTPTQSNTNSNVLPSTSLFGTTAPTFGAPVTTAPQGATSGTTNQTTSSLFQNVSPLPQSSTTSLFGTTNATSTNPFTTVAPQTGLFGSTNLKEPTQTSSLFGSNTTGVTSGATSLFNTSTPKVTPSLFGTTNTQPQLGKSLFDTSTTANTTSLFGNTSTLPNSDKLGGTNLFKGLSGNSQNTFGISDFTGQNKNQPNQGLFNETKTSLFSAPTTNFFNQGNLNTTHAFPQSTISSQQKRNDSMTWNSVSPALLNSSDPYGINRVTPLLETRYLTRGQLPTVPKPFSFPACGVILPSQYRRNKLNASTQFWQPISDNVPPFKKFSSTPQRFTSSTGRYTNFLSPLLLNSKKEWDTFNDRNDTNFVKSSCRQDSSMLTLSGKLVQSNKCLSRCNSVFRFPLSQYTTSLSPSQSTSCQNVTYRDDVFTETRPSASTQCFEKQEKTHQGIRGTVSQEPVVSTPLKKKSPSQNESSLEPTAILQPEHFDACHQKTHVLQNNPSLTRRTGRIANLLGEKTLKKRYNSNSFLKCTREGYSTRPSLETLQSYSDSRLAAVEDFTICHEMYGEITWPGLTDIRGISIDDDVIIEDRAVEVYPSKEEPPVPIGVGLNKPALVTLYNCGPKTPQENLTSEQLAQQYQEHVEKIRWFTKKMQAQFIALTPDYVWKFRVEHFSRYALLDDDMEEEEEVERKKEEKTCIISSTLQGTMSKDTCQSPLLFIPQKTLFYHDKKETFSKHLANFSNILDLNKTNPCTQTLRVEAFFVDNFVLSTSPNIVSFFPQQISITKAFHPADDSPFCLSNSIYDFSSFSSTETYSFETLYFYYVDSLLALTFQLFFEENYQLYKIFASQVQLIEEFVKAIKERHVPSNIRQFLVYILETWQLVYLLFGDLDYHDPKANVHLGKESSPIASSPEIEIPLEETDDSDFHRELYKHRITLLSEWFSSVNTPKVHRAIANLPVFSSNEINLKTGLLKEDECRLHRTLYYMMSNNVKQATTELMGNHPKEQIPFFRLALCLTGSASSALFGVPSNREPLFQQLIEWQKRQIYETIPLPILRIHHVLAGCIDRLVSKEALDWKTVFALLLWYPSIDASLYLKNYDIDDGASSTLYSTNATKATCSFEEGTVQKTTVLQRAFHTYTHYLLNLPNQNTTPAPLPDYLGVQRRNISDDDPIDLHYQLLRFFCYNEINYTKLFHLSSVCGEPRGIILLWPLFQILRFLNTKTTSKPPVQLYSYLDTLLYHYLSSLKLWKWCVLLIFTQVSRKIISKKKALQNILTVFYYGIPALFHDTSNSNDTNCYTNFLNFLQHPHIRVPFHFLLYVSLAKLPFSKKGIESCNIWLNCALASLQVPCETKPPCNKNTLPFFETLFHHRIPTDICPSATSLFCHGLIDLLVSKTFYSTVEKLCSIIHGQPVFTWKFLFLQKTSKNNSYMDQKRFIFSKILKKVEALYNQATSYPKIISFCDQDLNTRTLHEFCQLILSKSTLFLLQTEWEKCVLMPLCTFVTWIVDVLIFFSQKDFSEGSKILSPTKKETNNSSASFHFDDSMSHFCDVAQHLHDVAEKLLKFSASSSESLTSFSESNQPLLFIPPSQQKHSRLPSILTSINRYSSQAFQSLEVVYTCLNTILKSRCKSLTLKGDALDLMNNPQNLSDYGYGVLLAC